MLGEGGPMFLIQVRNDLGVATSSELVSGSLQSAPYVGVVVQLPVLDGPDLAALVRERLMATRDVDDAEPPHTKRDAVAHVGPAVIGTAVRHRIGHPIEDF